MSNKGEKQAGISALDFFCIGFGSIVGVGWALSINRWMANCGGPLPASVGYLMALVMMVPISLCYCELAPMMPVAGGGTAYAYRAFNEKVAFISGWAAFGGFVTIIPWEAIYICDVLSIMIPAAKGPVLYSLVGSDIHLGHLVFGTIFSCLLFWVNWKGATSSALFQRLITIILIGGGVLGMIAAIVHFDVNNFRGVVPSAAEFDALRAAAGTSEFSTVYAQTYLAGQEATSFYSNVARGTHGNFFGGAVAILASAPFFLAGFETIPQAVEDAKGDITAVGKTVVLSVSMACIFYALLLFCFGSAMPWQQFWSGGVFGSPAGGLLFTYAFGEGNAIGVAMYWIILVATLCGLFSTWNGFMMASPRLLMGMARGYMMPRALAKQNKYGTPSTGLIACFALSLAGPFLGMGLVDPLTLFAGAGFVLSWGLTAWSVVSLRKKEPNAERPYKLPGGSGTATFGGVVMAIIFVLFFVPVNGNPLYLEPMPIVLFICWMVFGLILYMVAAPARNAVTAEERAASLFERR